MNNVKYIKSFGVTGLWNGKFNVQWDKINSDVNIIVGINGEGKTTLINAINNYYKNPKLLASNVKVNANGINVPVKFIHSFDVPNVSKSKSKSLVYEELEKLVIKNNDTLSFFDYRMQALNYPLIADEVNKRIDEFFVVVNKFFADTNKRIEIDKENNSLVFINYKTDEHISLNMLSAGEKQLLIILLTVFLRNEAPFVLLMDEPELSLHITWQDKLISEIRRLNNKCQIILTTHSPSIFANGYENKIVFMEDIVTEKNIE